MVLRNRQNSIRILRNDAGKALDEMLEKMGSKGH